MFSKRQISTKHSILCIDVLRSHGQPEPQFPGALHVRRFSSKRVAQLRFQLSLCLESPRCVLYEMELHMLGFVHGFHPGWGKCKVNCNYCVWSSKRMARLWFQFGLCLQSIPCLLYEIELHLLRSVHGFHSSGGEWGTVNCNYRYVLNRVTMNCNYGSL